MYFFRRIERSADEHRTGVKNTPTMSYSTKQYATSQVSCGVLQTKLHHVGLRSNNNFAY